MEENKQERKYGFKSLKQSFANIKKCGVDTININCQIKIEAQKEKLGVQFLNSDAEEGVFGENTICYGKIKLKGRTLSAIKFREGLEVDTFGHSPLEYMLVIKKTRKSLRQSFNYEYYFSLLDFLQRSRREDFKIYSKEFEVFLIFKKPIRFEGALGLEIRDVSSNVLVEIIFSFGLVVTLLALGLVTYYGISYFYLVIILKRYNVGFVDWVMGREKLNLQFSISRGYMQKKRFEKGMSIFEEEICSICLMEFEKNEQILQLKCQHIFHYDCMMQWYQFCNT
jgi:hypothetical protein